MPPVQPKDKTCDDCGKPIVGSWNICSSCFHKIELQNSPVAAQSPAADCDNIQCKQLHEYLDSLLDLYGLDKSGYAVNKAARLQAHWSELERYKKAVEWLESKHHDLHWDDDDFWTVWDAKKAMTGHSIISAIEYAMNPTE